MIYQWYLSIGLAGCDITDEIELPDDATPDEIEQEIREAVFNHVEWSYALKREVRKRK